MSYKDRIADNNGEYEIPMFPGDAMIDFADTFRRIEAAGFSGHYRGSYGTLDELARGGPGVGVTSSKIARHGDAGYDEVIECARENELNLPDFGIGGK